MYMVIRRCAWCGTNMGLAPDVVGEETHGLCHVCAARLDAEAALDHAIVGLRAITDELERAKANLWPPDSPLRNQ